MHLRPVVLMAALASTVLCAPGHAAGCPLISDARGDATPVHYGVATPVDEAAGARTTDILSADVWTDRTSLHAVVRLAELPTKPAVARGYGHMWAVRLRAEGGAITLYAIEANGHWGYNALWETIVGNEDAGASRPENLYNTAGVPDATKAEIRLTAPLKLFAPYTKVGTGVRWKPSVWTFVVLGPPASRVDAAGYAAYVGPGGVGNQSDRADGKRPVTVGRPDCKG